MTKTVILSVTCAVALMIPGLAPAQVTDFNPFDPYSPSYRDRYDPDYYEERQRERERDARREQYWSDQRIREDFRAQDRRNAIESCLGYDRNPAARAACLDAIR